MHGVYGVHGVHGARANAHAHSLAHVGCVHAVRRARQREAGHEPRRCVCVGAGREGRPMVRAVKCGGTTNVQHQCPRQARACTVRACAVRAPRTCTACATRTQRVYRTHTTCTEGWRGVGARGAACRVPRVCAGHARLCTHWTRPPRAHWTWGVGVGGAGGARGGKGDLRRAVRCAGVQPMCNINVSPLGRTRCCTATATASGTNIGRARPSCAGVQSTPRGE